MSVAMSPEEFLSLRRGAGLTQNQAAAILGVTTRTLCRWESGLTQISLLKAEAIRLLLVKQGGQS